MILERVLVKTEFSAIFVCIRLQRHYCKARIHTAHLPFLCYA